MRRVILLGFLTGLLVGLVIVSAASAHPARVAGIPKPHKIWSAIADRWRDPPPRPPDINCSKPEHVGKEMEIYDPVLREFITWICVDDGEGNIGWRRRPWEHQWFDWEAQPNIVTWDWHRACRSIVCKKELRWHVRRYVVRMP